MTRAAFRDVCVGGGRDADWLSAPTDRLLGTHRLKASRTGAGARQASGAGAAENRRRRILWGERRWTEAPVRSLLVDTSVADPCG